ncbi:hypothetical protein [Methanococcus voltae]|uniref:Uncharacterized protein n=1 Tax=Methanococcus voltae (strain ATCC BAA-1334 / A3) TaxID=456320 RepID=D7DV07_METV3|nr:hypothetical protein [Methanococcus voltae]MCS3900771.1 hypothetical protein [Methanococcus voltae]
MTSEIKRNLKNLFKMRSGYSCKLRSVSFVLILFTVFFGLMGSVSSEVAYKWVSEEPIKFIALSNIQSEYELEKYLNSDDLIVFYLDENFRVNNEGEEFLKKLGIYTSIEYANYVGGSMDNPNALFKLDNEEYYVLKVFDRQKIYYEDYVEVAPKKIFLPKEPDFESKKFMDFLGTYVSSYGLKFAYLNKVPNGYNESLIWGVAVQNVMPDNTGDGVIQISGYNMIVDVIDSDLILKKLKIIDEYSNEIKSNYTYISTGAENLNVLDINTKEPISKYHEFYIIEEFLRQETRNDNIYSRYGGGNGYDNNYLKKHDLLAFSFYPMIYLDKSPDSIRNDPMGGYYPTNYDYQYLSNGDYWMNSRASETGYFRYYDDEILEDVSYSDISRQTWTLGDEQVSLRQENELNNIYDVFNYWYCKNYGYLTTNGVNAIILPSSDENLTDMLFDNKYNDDIFWRSTVVNSDNGITYIVVPGENNYYIKNNVSILQVPNFLETKNLISYVQSYYKEPEDEEFGVYVSDSVYFDKNVLKNLTKSNRVWICSFEEYSYWTKNYYTTNMGLTDGYIVLTTNSNRKPQITCYDNETKSVSAPKLENGKYYLKFANENM